MKSTKAPKLLASNEYTKDAVKVIGSAKERICLMTMIASYDDTTDDLFDAIITAKTRGVKVDLAADIFTYSEIGGHLRFKTSRSHKIKPVETLKKKLRSVDVKINWLGTDSSFLFSGRTHSKWLVVDDTVYTFGGINLYDEGVNNTDFMLRLDNHDLADNLVREYHRIIRANKTRNKYHSYHFSIPHGQVLIDGGRARDSIIYRRAKQLVQDAKSVVYVSQYCPTGKLADLLKNKPTKLYFNPWQQSQSLNAIFIRISSWKTNLKTDYSRQNYIHSKFIICTMPNSSKVAITGSHNFAGGGVWLGTREIALETNDSDIITQLESFVQKHLA